MILSFFSTLTTWRTFLIVLALMALSALIWFIGPLIEIAEYEPFEPSVTRITAIALLFIGALLIALTRFIVARRRNAQLIKNLMQTDDLTPAFARNDEVETIRSRFEEAMAVLKTASLGTSGKAYFADLPWYIIVGPPATGKTTIFRNSGLDFPLAEKLGGDALQGISGTRNCDWWITDDAVLIDTAGRYTTQDVNRDADNAAWIGFLNILKKARRRRPINGLMLAVSITDLVARDEVDRKRFAEVMRRRIQELLNTFEVRLPVYLLVTKSDLVSGFNEYFADMDEVDRQQVWGMTFPVADGGRQPGEEFQERFNELVVRLDAGVAERLRIERDLTRRCKMFTFVDEFASLGPLLHDFIGDVFKQNRFERQAMLRGVYFTSGTQEGTPTQRLVGAFSRTFGLSAGQLVPYAGRGKAFFIRRVLTDVIFPEQGLIGANPRLERRLFAMHSAGYAAAAMLLIGAFGYSAIYMNQIHEKVEQVEEAVLDTSSRFLEVNLPRVPFDGLLPALNAAGDMVEKSDSSKSWLPWLALAKPSTPKLFESATNAYDRILVKGLLRSSTQRLADQISIALQTPGDTGNGAIRRYLPAYLMLGDPANYQANAVSRVLRGEVQTAFPLAPDDQRDMNGHVEDLLALLPIATQLDQGLIRDARSRLANIPQVDQVYRLLQQEAAQSPRLRPVSLIALIGNQALELNSALGPAPTQIDGFYTRQGFYDFFLTQAPRVVREAMGSDWVTGQADTSSKAYRDLVQQVADRYTQDYIQTWVEALSRVRVVQFNDLNRGLAVIQELAKPNSPLQQLMAAVELNTKLPPPDATTPAVPAGASQTVGTTAQSALQTAGNVVGSLTGTGFAGAGLTGDNWPGKPIETAFGPVHQLMAGQAAAPGTPSIARVQQLMGSLYGNAGSIATAPDPAAAAYQYLANQAQNSTADAISQLRSEGPIYPQPLQMILPQVGQYTTAAIIRLAFQYVNGIWQREIIPVCNATIAGRYPLERGASLEVTLDDFANLFRPSGVIDGFFNDYLKTFVVKRGGSFAPATVAGQALDISSATIAQFQRADTIKTTFFGGGGTAPTLKFSITPALLDASALQATFELDGTSVVYRHEPPRTTDFTWPNRGEASVASITIRYVDGTAVNREEKGVWALFRLIDSAGITRRTQADYSVGLANQNGQGVQYDLRAASVNNAFDLSQLSAFRCPDSL